MEENCLLSPHLNVKIHEDKDCLYPQHPEEHLQWGGHSLFADVMKCKPVGSPMATVG